MCKQSEKEYLYNGKANTQFDLDLILYIADEKRKLLTKTNLLAFPCQILMNIFELFIDNFDGTDLETRQKELYDCLMTLYQANQKKPLMNSLEENFSAISSLIVIFRANKKEIENSDTELYYALLNFIDMLKTRKGNMIYYKIIS